MAEIDQTAAEMNNLDLSDTEHLATKTLTNPLILAKVFNSVDISTLKSARLVCSVWADVGATFLGQQGRITFASSPKYWLKYRGFKNSKEFTSFDHKLAKNVKLIMKCDCIGDCSCPPEEVESCQNLPPNFVILLPEICDKLDTLKFLVGRTFQPRWHEIWRTHQFSNLTQISIIVAEIDHDLGWGDGHVPRLEVPEFRPLPNLKVLSVVMLPGYENDFVSNFLSPITQGLLNCALNLEKFELTANFYPDLTPCRKLDEVKFDYQECKFSLGYPRELDISVTRMLDNCRDSLKKLTLDYHGCLSNATIKLDLHLPNLTHLKMDASPEYKIEDLLNITNLPKLTHFSITSCYNIFDMIENFHLPHAGITSLHVACTYDPETENYDGLAVVKLINLFPAVNEFKLNLSIDFIEYIKNYPWDFVHRNVQDQDFVSLKETLQSLSGWGLTDGGHVEIKLEYGRGGYSFEELDYIGASVLQGVAEWRGLANTCLKFLITYVGGSFKLLGGVRDGLLSCRTIRSVTWEGFEMDEQDSIELNAFIGENNLPVSVLDPGFWAAIWKYMI